MSSVYIQNNEEQLLSFATMLAKRLQAPLVVYLQGDLGAGKTTFTRGLIQALGYQGAVKSPTYALVESYAVDEVMIYHLDLYRLSDPEELEYLGFRDYLDQNSIIIIEWPDKGQGFLPINDVMIQFDILEQGRKLTLSSQSDKGQQLLKNL